MVRKHLVHARGEDLHAPGRRVVWDFLPPPLHILKIRNEGARERVKQQRLLWCLRFRAQKREQPSVCVAIDEPSTLAPGLAFAAAGIAGTIGAVRFDAGATGVVRVFRECLNTVFCDVTFPLGNFGRVRPLESEGLAGMAA